MTFLLQTNSMTFPCKTIFQVFFQFSIPCTNPALPGRQVVDNYILNITLLTCLSLLCANTSSMRLRFSLMISWYARLRARHVRGFAGKSPSSSPRSAPDIASFRCNLIRIYLYRYSSYGSLEKNRRNVY